MHSTVFASAISNFWCTKNPSIQTARFSKGNLSATRILGTSRYLVVRKAKAFFQVNEVIVVPKKKRDKIAHCIQRSRTIVRETPYFRRPLFGRSADRRSRTRPTLFSPIKPCRSLLHRRFLAERSTTFFHHRESRSARIIYPRRALSQTALPRVPRLAGGRLHTAPHDAGL